MCLMKGILSRTEKQRYAGLFLKCGNATLFIHGLCLKLEAHGGSV